MIVQVDSREKSRAIQKILQYFDSNDIRHVSTKLYVGDYARMDNMLTIVDRKQNLFEVCCNVCQDHNRFRAELIRAKEAGIKLYILVEHGEEIQSLADVMFWHNPRRNKSPKAVEGEKLYKILCTLERKYGCEFVFCNKEDTGRKIIELLNKEE